MSATMSQAGRDGPDPGTGVTSREPVKLLRAGHKAPPLRSAHSQKPGEANIFSREWRANGGGTIRPHLPSPADANREAARARQQHVPVEVHYSRKGETVSTLLCKCGTVLSVDNESRLLGHRMLAAAFTDHRAGRPPKVQPMA